MLWRHLCLVRAWSVAGLFSGLLILGPRRPGPVAATRRSRATAPPAEVVTETVDLLEASKAGDLTWWLTARGRIASA